MDSSGSGKAQTTALSFRYIANNEELEELYQMCEDDPPTPQGSTCASPTTYSDNASPKKLDKTASLIDKYFKRVDKQEKPLDKQEKPVDKQEKPVDKQEKPADKQEKLEEQKADTSKSDECRSSSVPKEVTSSPVKDYLNRLSKRANTSEAPAEGKDTPNETWKIFSDFKFKIAQAVEDIKSRSVEETREKLVPRENSMSDSEENSTTRDTDQHSVGDTDNQVSSLDSSLQNLSEVSPPITAKVNEYEPCLPIEKIISESSDVTHKNIGERESLGASEDFVDDSLMDVESGVEALEECQVNGIDNVRCSEPSRETPMTNMPPPYLQPITTNFSCPPNRNNNIPTTSTAKQPQQKNYLMNWVMVVLSAILILSYVFFPNSNLWNGFLLGIFVFYLLGVLQQYVLDTYFCEWGPDRNSYYQLKKTTLPQYTIPSVKEHTPLKKHEGWINHYRMSEYDPYTYQVNRTKTAFMKLEGCNLRISYTKTKIPKRELWDEKIQKVEFYQHRLYNLSGARVILLPKGLVRRRLWSKKYPICIVLSDNQNIQVLEKENVEHKTSDSICDKKVETECAETNTSPEKKKKFVWRKREKSVTHADEPSKEGLRHRLVRKMHRDKKGDNVSTSADHAEKPSEKNLHIDETNTNEVELSNKSKSTNNIPKEDPAEEELDDTELSRIKDFLEETELDGGAEGAVEDEWSVRVKPSRDTYSNIYLFARTGREKHEWFRRLNMAIQDVKTSTPENSTSEQKVTSEGERDLEVAVFKVTEKDTVSFVKPNNKSVESLEDTETITSLSQPLQPEDMDSYEKLFWPYLLKIIQSPKAGGNSCLCRSLPGEVTWINTVLARIMFDVMRDPQIIQRVQTRIQKKLHTLKLPPFMSPLLVTELQLGGACPLIEHVWGPSWDDRGVWLDADLRYDGGGYISILTQINLMKLKDRTESTDLDQLSEVMEQTLAEDVRTSSAGGQPADSQSRRKKRHAVYHSELEDSAESSSDDDIRMDMEDDITAETVSSNTEGSSKKKFLRMVDKIATNKYFQTVTDYKYVKRAMEGISNTDIKVLLQVRGLHGRLALNFPPPPHDRLWLGFRTNPQLVLKAKPAFGARSLRFTQISSWIEQKLTREFQKVLVLPNMEDIIIDLMTPTPISFE